MKYRIGRVHISEEELSELLGYEGGRIRYIGFMPDYGEIGIVIEHSEMPIVGDNCPIPQVKREINERNYKG